MTPVDAHPCRRRGVRVRVTRRRWLGLDIEATPGSMNGPVAAVPETGYLLAADLTGYTAYNSVRR